MTADLVCLPALAEILAELEGVRRDCKMARNRLMTIRETLDRVLDVAFRRRSFGPLEHLFRDEEAAMEAYELLAARLAAAEERWIALQAALAHEREMMLSDPVPRHRLN
ncbi:MAG TPA: hypothetical protein VGU19_15960 [Microvirga sp.]|jgi:hypothetical protein|nr:hypothetical protein [Microvirga sp.]